MLKIKPAQKSIARYDDDHNHGKEKRMKIKCDVCDKLEASVFCCADEAALCDACDRHVHHANMLASQHHRFSLLQPPSSSSRQSPLCDICQERRALLFCQEDRAILCRECDIPIHKANEHTKKHSRFLLTGVKLSTSSSSPSSSSNNRCESKKQYNTNNSNKKNLQQQQPSLHDENHNTPIPYKGVSSCSIVGRVSSPSSVAAVYSSFDNNVSMSISSISEYLETLPGWRVDDFLDPSIATDTNFQKTFDNFAAMEDHQVVENQMVSWPQEDELSFWVPQMSPYDPNPLPKTSDSITATNGGNKFWSNVEDDAFTVPEMSHRPLKKSRQ